MKKQTWFWKNEGAREAVVIVAAVVLFFGLERGGAAQNYSAAMAAPLSAIAAPAVRFFGTHHRQIRPISQWFHQSDQVKQLTILLAESESQLATLRGVQQENQELRQLLENRHLDLRERRIGRTIASYALPSVWLGKNTDITPNSLVLYKGVLLGKITEISGGVGKVALLAEPSDFTVMVTIDGTVVGVTTMHNGSFGVGKLPPEAVIQPGQRVVTVGQLGVPPDLLIGLTTGGVEYSEGEGRVAVDQMVSFYETALVEISPL